MTEKERMLAGLPYRAWLEDLPALRARAHSLCHQFNSLAPDARAERVSLLRELLGKAGEPLWLEQPFRCDYGCNITVGNEFYANFNCVILDTAPVTIGDSVMFGPNVSIYTAGHPVHPQARASGYEYGIPVTIGSRVWLGGSVVITPGVSIGEGAVIGAGSVVTRDIPANVVAAGNPCRVLRAITEADRVFYFKDRTFADAGIFLQGED